eukprot:5624473-Amphidinium_carterae.1
MPWRRNCAALWTKQHSNWRTGHLGDFSVERKTITLVACWFSSPRRKKKYYLLAATSFSKRQFGTSFKSRTHPANWFSYVYTRVKQEMAVVYQSNSNNGCNKGNLGHECGFNGQFPMF